MGDLKTELKEKIKGWELSVGIRNLTRQELKKYVKLKEEELRNAKYNLGQATKAWVQSRKELKRVKKRLSSLDYVKRKYVKEHLGDVLNKMTEVIE